MYRIVFSSQSQKDAKKINQAGHRKRVEKLLDVLKNDPFQMPPPYEKLLGDLSGAYSRRINIQHRLVYQVYVKEGVVKIIRMWTHYD